MLLLEGKDKKNPKKENKNSVFSMSQNLVWESVITETQIIVFLHHNFPGVGIYIGRGGKDQSYIFYQ